MPARLLHAWNRRRSSGRLRRSNRWRRITAGILLTGLLLICLVLGALSSPAILTPTITAIANRLLVNQVRIDHASFDLRRLNLQIEGVRVSHRGPDAQLEPFLEAERILVRPDWSGLFWGELPVRSVLVVRPVLYVIEYPQSTDNNLERVTQQRRAQGGTDEQPLTDSILENLQLPDVFLRAAEIRFATRDEADQLDIRNAVPLTGRINSGQSQVQFILKQSDTGGRDNVEIAGAYRPGDHSFRIRMRDFAFDHPISYAFPARIRNWWDQLAPTGRVPSTIVTIRNQQQLRVDASMSFDDLALTLPFAPDNPPRMQGVNGFISIVNNEPSAEIEGSIEGIRYRVSGHASGLKQDAPFTLSVSTPPFLLPEEFTLLDALPDVARHIYDNLEPSGYLSLDTTVSRSEPAGPLKFEGAVTAHDAAVRYFRFAYPLSSITGTVRFNNNAVELVDFEGVGPTGAQATLSGRIAPIGPDPAVQIAVDIDDLPIDQYLFGALNEGSQNAIRLFFDRDHYETLRVAGRIDAPATQDDDVIPPGLGGTVDARFRLDRPEGPDREALTVTRIETRGLKGIIKYWPYPLVSEGGTFEIASHHLHIEDISVAGPTGATARVSGELERNPDNGKLDGTVLVSPARVPIDPFLLKAIPGNASTILSDLQPSGWLDARTAIHLGYDSPVTFEVSASISQASILPYSGTYRINDLHGSFDLDNHSLRLHEIVGVHGGTNFRASGSLSWLDPDHLTYQADLTAEKLILEPGLTDLITPGTRAHQSARELHNTTRPSGQVDLDLSVLRTVDAERPSISLTIEPDRLAFDANRFRFDVSGISGSARLEDDRLFLEELRGDAEEGRFGIDGELTTDFRQLDLAIEASDTHLSPTTRALLPVSLNRFIDTFQLAGDYSFRGTLHREPIDEQVRTTLRGRLDLTNAELHTGLAIRNANAGLEIDIDDDKQAEWPMIDIRIAASSLIVANRDARQATLTITNRAQRERLLVTDILGKTAGGTASGHASTDLTDDGWYRMGVELVNLDLDQFLAVPELTTPTPEDLEWIDAQLSDEFLGEPRHFATQIRPSNNGLLSASVYVQGRHGDPASRIGRGDIDASKVGLLNQPLGLTILRAFNFTLPSTRSLDSARVRFLVDGDLIRFDGIQITAPDFAIIGAGVMEFESQELDLALFSRSRTDLGLGIQQLFNNIRDQIACLRVQGTVAEPTTNLSIFPGLTASLRSTVGIEEIPPFLEHLFTAEEP